MTPFTANFSTLHSARVSDGVLEYSTYTYVQCSSYQVRLHYDSNLFIIKMCVKYLDFCWSTLLLLAPHIVPGLALSVHPLPGQYRGRAGHHATNSYLYDFEIRTFFIF